MKFAKYQALGNDYLVIDSLELDGEFTSQRIRLICDRHYGVGADGILVGSILEESKRYAVRIFNPDGSEAEKSGNGLRIFARYLYDLGLASENEFKISTIGGDVLVLIKEKGNSIEVNMGKASFQSRKIPVLGADRVVKDEILIIEGREFLYNAVSLGNPHCVLFVDSILKEDIIHFGPLIEKHKNFPNRTNVQFVKVLSSDSIQIGIWERGAGYTLSSGTSACAAGLVSYRAGKCIPSIRVYMPGGSLVVTITENDEVTLTGPVFPVFRGYGPF